MVPCPWSQGHDPCVRDAPEDVIDRLAGALTLLGVAVAWAPVASWHLISGADTWWLRNWPVLPLGAAVLGLAAVRMPRLRQVVLGGFLGALSVFYLAR